MSSNNQFTWDDAWSYINSDNHIPKKLEEPTKKYTHKKEYIPTLLTFMKYGIPDIRIDKELVKHKGNPYISNDVIYVGTAQQYNQIILKYKNKCMGK